MKKIIILGIVFIVMSGCSDKSDNEVSNKADETQKLNSLLENR